ncbi:MAG: 2Fe-2S iron-sulfur cluster binding domain-containing protein [Cyanobacteria bacterium]|nr:2Fe-2S iron-sulfur cluster binding domain-containing protein [Cyanobacteria bacterium CG_2015-16_32_12]NCO76735.1 2Fe-2S iron-sulfur cluster binding domain-containing protein [Cyanobacteria bacterium CG_2015-22_32_23]NCQ04381.1 2Fe-2S iron-sulfur cluster binding domain-containing protein [Cyanobacteria bacterium CG_2015-09_32_10]NCQ43342.1 2Fe-2S iron-sulfur cluster binding domain-containing protein [Cyanobacteria bacterium CG_2015-04_32_10]NCS84404.1 2Fe-2S iron-sulfur cluster binding domai
MTNIYTVEIINDGQTYTLQVPEDQKILDVAEQQNVIIPNSCNAGVCTTCAAKIISGEVEQSEGMGLSPELQGEGYALLCVSYPRSNLKVETGKEDEVYDRQFGKAS